MECHNITLFSLILFREGSRMGADIITTIIGRLPLDPPSRSENPPVPCSLCTNGLERRISHGEM